MKEQKKKMQKKTKLIVLFGLLTTFFVVQSCRDSLYSDGKWLYEQNCQSCHEANGQSLGLLIPPLANSDFLVNHKERIACIIRYGLDGELITVNGQEYNGVMYGLKDLSDIDINNIINYINNSFGNKNGYTSLEEVQESLKNCEVKE